MRTLALVVAVAVALAACGGADTTETDPGLAGSLEVESAHVYRRTGTQQADLAAWVRNTGASEACVFVMASLACSGEAVRLPATGCLTVRAGELQNAEASVAVPAGCAVSGTAVAEDGSETPRFSFL